MTVRLVLMRHAKSDWTDADLTDHDRVLNARGRRDCGRVGNWLNTQGISPDQVLCSTATRAQETWAGISACLAAPSPAELNPELYLAAPDTMLHHLQDATGSCVAMVAHNHGIAALAWHLLPAPLEHPGFGKFPTLSTLVVDFDIPNWNELAPGRGQPVKFIVPRELPD